MSIFVWHFVHFIKMLRTSLITKLFGRKLIALKYCKMCVRTVIQICMMSVKRSVDLMLCFNSLKKKNKTENVLIERKKRNSCFLWCFVVVYCSVCWLVYSFILCLCCAYTMECPFQKVFFFFFWNPFLETLFTTYSHLMMTQKKNQMKITMSVKIEKRTAESSNSTKYTEECTKETRSVEWNESIQMSLNCRYMKKNKVRERRRKSVEKKHSRTTMKIKLDFCITNIRTIKTMNKTKIHLKWYGWYSHLLVAATVWMNCNPARLLCWRRCFTMILAKQIKMRRKNISISIDEWKWLRHPNPCQMVLLNKIARSYTR